MRKYNSCTPRTKLNKTINATLYTKYNVSRAIKQRREKNIKKKVRGRQKKVKRAIKERHTRKSMHWPSPTTGKAKKSHRGLRQDQKKNKPEDSVLLQVLFCFIELHNSDLSHSISARQSRTNSQFRITPEHLDRRCFHSGGKCKLMQDKPASTFSCNLCVKSSI